MKNALILIFLGVLASCNGGGDSKDCSSASKCSDKQTPNGSTNTKAKVTFRRTVFWDQKLLIWRKITPEELHGGGMGAEIPIYSDFVGLNSNEAMASILLADQQGDEPGLFTPTMYNKIPYVSGDAEADTAYVYNYKKLDLSGNEIGGKTGSMIIVNGRAYIPFTNEMFGGVFFPENVTSSQSGFVHRLSIVAQPTSKKASEVYSITFKASLVVPNRDFNVIYSEAMRNISMTNRWDYFYKDNDGIANTDLELATLSEATSTPESIPLDIKIVFKSAPKIEIAYSIFDEDGIVIPNNYVETQTQVLRGNSFYEKSYALNSDQDFQLKFKINNTLTTLTNSNREAELRNIPSGQLWRLTFGYDLTQNPAYTSGKQLLKPLRPICNEVGEIPFYPIQELRAKENYKALGGFLSSCHPDLFEKKIITAAEISTTPIELTDSWFWAFSYFPNYARPSTPNAQHVVAGHFYGIKNIEFRISGCLKVMSREASPAPVNPNIYEIKNNESAECSSGPGDTGWMRYDVSRVISIFDNTLPYAQTLGLKELVDTYRNAIPKNSVEFLFNGDTFFRHVH